MNFEMIKNRLNLEAIKNVHYTKHWNIWTGFLHIPFNGFKESFDESDIVLNETATKKIVNSLDSKFIKSYIVMLIQHCERFEKERNAIIKRRQRLKKNLMQIVQSTDDGEQSDSSSSEDLESWVWMTEFIKLMGSARHAEDLEDVVFNEETTKRVFDMLEDSNDKTGKNLTIKKFIVMLIENCERFEKERNDHTSRHQNMKDKLRNIVS